MHCCNNISTAHKWDSCYRKWIFPICLFLFIPSLEWFITARYNQPPPEVMLLNIICDDTIYTLTHPFQQFTVENASEALPCRGRDSQTKDTGSAVNDNWYYPCSRTSGKRCKAFLNASGFWLFYVTSGEVLVYLLIYLLHVLFTNSIFTMGAISLTK